MQRVSKRPTNLQEFNQQFPPRADGHKPTATNAMGREHAPGRERLLAQPATIEDLQRALSSLSNAALGEDAQLLLALAHTLPLTLRNEPGLMDLCAHRCLEAANHASLATREGVWTILRDTWLSLPQPTAVALRNVMQKLRHHQPATVV